MNTFSIAVTLSKSNLGTTLKAIHTTAKIETITLSFFQSIGVMDLRRLRGGAAKSNLQDGFAQPSFEGVNVQGAMMT